MPSKKVQIPKTPVKPDDDVDPATIAKNNENKESARKLISDLKVKIPRVHSPIKREELSDIFCDIKCNCELEEAGTTDRSTNSSPQPTRRYWNRASQKKTRRNPPPQRVTKHQI